MIDTDKILELSERDDLPITIKFMKLVEEVGELSQIMLAEGGHTNASNSLKELSWKEKEDGVDEEIIDCLICILDLAYKYNLTDDDINDLLAKKTSKWEKKLV